MQNIAIKLFLYLKWTIDFLEITLHIKLSFPLRISSVNMTKSADLIAFTKEILNGKLHFFALCEEMQSWKSNTNVKLLGYRRAWLINWLNGWKMQVTFSYIIMKILHLSPAKISSRRIMTQPDALREMCPNTEFFLVRIFTHSNWIRRDTKYLSVFSSNGGKYGPEKTPYLDIFHAVIWLLMN